MIINIDTNGFNPDELTAAKLICGEFERFFQEFPCEGEITVLNHQLPAGYSFRDIDILILMEIEEGHFLKVECDGIDVQLEGVFIFNIETKSHSHFTVRKNEVWVKYGGEEHNATNQAWNVKNNLLNCLKKECTDVPFITDIVFLPMCAKETSLAIFGAEERIPKNFLDSSFNTCTLLRTTFVNNAPSRYRSSTEAIDVIKNYLFTSRTLPSETLNKLELLTINSLQEEQDNLFTDTSNFYILQGSPGAGKTILMLGKCRELLAKGKKCLYLTYNKQLVLDLQRLQEVIRFRSQYNPLLNLRIETWDFYITKLYSFHNYYSPLGSIAPSFEEKTFRVLNRYKQQGKQLLAVDENKNHNNIFRYSQVDYAFVDEAQDLPSAIFETLESFYSSNICLAIGTQQEYSFTELRVTKNRLSLMKIHRQKELPSRLVNRFLEYTKMEHMYILQTPVPYQLVGGRSIIYVGAVNETFYEEVFQYLKDHGCSNIDFLYLHINRGDAAANTTLPHYYGGNVEGENTLKLGKFRYYHYNSCRGLEGNVVLYEKIDTYYDWCVDSFGEEQAKKRVFIALTRVKDVAIFTFKDLNHWLYTDVLANFSAIKKSFDLN